MNTATESRLADLRAEIEGFEGNAAYFTATGRHGEAATARARANALRAELAEVER